MLKKFRLWLEEREKVRRIKQTVLTALGFNDEIDPSTIKIQGLDRFKNAVSSLDIQDEEERERLERWPLEHKGATLTQFLADIDPDDIPDQEELPGDQAQLPPEQPAMPNTQQGQMPPPPPEGQALPRKPTFMGGM